MKFGPCGVSVSVVETPYEEMTPQQKEILWFQHFVDTGWISWVEVAGNRIVFVEVEPIKEINLKVKFFVNPTNPFKILSDSKEN